MQRNNIFSEKKNVKKTIGTDNSAERKKYKTAVFFVVVSFSFKDYEDI